MTNKSQFVHWCKPWTRRPPLKKKIMSKKTSPKKIVEHLNEPRPIPMGMKEFDEWAERIIAGAMIPGLTEESARFTLACMILHLGPTESHKPDAHFIHGLRTSANKQVAQEVLRKIDEDKKERIKDDLEELARSEK